MAKGIPPNDAWSRRDAALYLDTPVIPDEGRLVTLAATYRNLSMGLTEAEMVRLWESHTRLEFATKDAEATVATMAPDNYVNHVPVLTGTWLT